MSFRWTDTLREPLPALSGRQAWSRIEEAKGGGWNLLADPGPAPGVSWYHVEADGRSPRRLSLLEDARLKRAPAVLRRWMKRGYRVRLLAWKVGKRAVFHVSTPEGARICKLYRRAHMLEERWRAFGPRSAELGPVPQVLDWDAERKLLSVEWRPGVSLFERWSSGKGDVADAERIADHLMWLAGHEIPDGFPRHGVEDEVRALERRLGVFERILARPPRRARELTERIVESLREAPPATDLPSHGDFHDKQILVGGRASSLIDLDEASAAHPARDVGNILAHLRLRALKGAPVAWAPIARGICDRIVPARGIEESVHRWTASSLLRLALIYSRRSRSPRLIDDLLESAERALTRERDWKGVFSARHVSDRGTPAPVVEPRKRCKDVRILLYSPDSYGLGHIRRSLSVTKTLLDEFGDSRARLITGAPRAHYFDYPSRCDYVKLPSVTKDDDGHYAALDEQSALGETVHLRSRLIREAVGSFRPDVLYVDHCAPGLCGEMMPVLRRLGRRSSRPLRLLGMRDVIDEPAVVRAAWERSGTIDLMRRFYDAVLVFGQREIFDPVREYGVPADVARKMKFVGYIPRNGRKAEPSELKRRFAPKTGRLVLVTLGGGGDGNLILRAFLDGYRAIGTDPSFEVVAVTGPLMSPGKRARFSAEAANLPGLTLLEHSPELPDLLEAADFAVSMGGYNTVCEMACAGTPALIVPRTFPRKEQLLRAQFLSRRGVVDYLPPERVTPDALVRRVIEGLEAARPAPGWGLDFRGLENTSATVSELLSRPESTRRPSFGLNLFPVPATGAAS